MARAHLGSLWRKQKPCIRAVYFAVVSLSLIWPDLAQALTAQLVASGLTQPLFVTAAPGDTTHIYIVQQNGRILKLDLQTGQLTTFFTVGGLTGTSGEQGLLGMAFDPGYATNRKFYLNFTVPGGAFGNGVTHVSQFQAPNGSASEARPNRRRRRRRFPRPTPTPTPTLAGLAIDPSRKRHP